jgi:hypothetical protein
MKHPQTHLVGRVALMIGAALFMVITPAVSHGQTGAIACPTETICPEGATCRCRRDGDIVVREVDGDADGVIDRRDRTTYRSDGQILRAEVDLDADGVIDTIGMRGYDDDGRHIWSSIDEDGDGVFESRQWWIYGPDGETRVETRIDHDNDGVIDLVVPITNTEPTSQPGG